MYDWTYTNQDDGGGELMVNLVETPPRCVFPGEYRLPIPHFSFLFLSSLSSLLLIRVSLYNSCPGAAPALFGAQLERWGRGQMFNFRSLCALLTARSRAAPL